VKTKIMMVVLAAACAAVAYGVAQPVGGSVEVASGLLSRSLDTRGGHVLGKSYKTADGTEFMRGGSPEFAFRVDGKMYAGWSAWKDVASEKTEGVDGARATRVTGVSSDGRVGFELTYTTYPGIALVRKTLAVENKSDKEFFVTDVDVETFRLRSVGCTSARTLRRFGRYREEGPYIGNWNDPLVVIHDYMRQNGMAIGNEAVSVVKRTTTFQDGDYVVVGTAHEDSGFPFKKRLRPGEKWTAAPAFTAPYSKCGDPMRAVEGPVADYVRKHMGVRVERIPKKPMFVYNTWMPFTTHIDAKLIRELADAAAECGVEEFVIDDGWQINISNGKYGRGDWEVDEKKFPGGLKPTFDYIRSKGMRPGLWISLAWADPSSRPLNEHPEWFVRGQDGKLANIHTSGSAGPRTACMATPWHEYIKGKILGLVKDHGLAYVKLDLAIATSAYIYDDRRTGCYATDHPGHADHDDSYAEIFASCMKLFDELHEAAPDLFIDCTFETAGRLFLMDYGIAKHAEGNWLSNIGHGAHGQGRLEMRDLAWGRTPALPAASLVIGNLGMNGEGHMLSFKSLAGALPIMLGDPRKLSAPERAEYREWSSWLKGLEKRHSFMSFRQDLPEFGEPQEGAWDGFARINTETKSGGLVGVFRRNAAARTRRVSVRGLDPNATYAVLKGAKGVRVAELTGKALEETGFDAVLPERCDGELYEIIRR
jgi:alpha-galactosidase